MCEVVMPSINQEHMQKFMAIFSELKTVDELFAPKPAFIENCILRLLSFYHNHKTSLDKRHTDVIIFTEIPHVCFKNHIENGIVLIKVLGAIDELSSIAVPHIVLFLTTLVLTNKTLPQSTIKKRNEMNKASFTALRYFLHHAVKHRLTIRHKRLTDMIRLSNPLYFSKFLFFADPRCLLSLLQFGLRFHPFRQNCGVRIHPIFLCAAELLTWFIQIDGAWNSDENHLEISREYAIQKLSKYRTNFKILLLSTNNPHEVTSELVHTLIRSLGNIQLEDVRPYLNEFLDDPDYEICRPPKLQYMCRYVIRSRLDKKWRLPYGIWKLNLPRALAKYLNFTTDERGYNILKH